MQKNLKIGSAVWIYRLCSLPIGLLIFTCMVGALKASEDSGKLSSLKIFNRVILLVKEEYVDPNRIDPQKILLASLEALEKQLPELIVSTPINGVITVQAGSIQQKFSIQDVDSLWAVSFRLRDIFTFIEPKIRSKLSASELEYVAINGMLGTLDPHSMLLEPRTSREMKLATKGEFGGLGIVISGKDGYLTVMKIMDGSPAVAAGIEAKDRIQKIDDVPTENIDLNETVEILRGKPGTPVKLTILRHGETVPRIISVIRAIIPVDTVSFKLLADNIGYIKVKSFHNNTAAEVKDAIANMKKIIGGELKGVLMDLRDNPGGLLNESVALVDLFLADGPVVVTKGSRASKVDQEMAHSSPDDDVKVPIVMIVNGGSASASEIVAGALKYRGRGIVIGQRTFGKGSVQMLYDFPDNSSLKLTIAEYFAAGTKSIQAGGITPDVQLQPLSVEKIEKINLFPGRQMREENLEAHLGKNTLRGDEKPSCRIDYISEDIDPEILESTRLSSNYVEDEEIALARQILLLAKGPSTDELLTASRQVAKKIADEQTAKIEKSLKKIGVNWAAGPRSEAVAEISMRLKKIPRGQAGQSMEVELELINRGKEAVYRLYGLSDSATAFFRDKQMIVGKMAPGEKRMQKMSFTIAPDVLSRRDFMRIQLLGNDNKKLNHIDVPIEIVGKDRPILSFSVVGIKQKSEKSFEIALSVQNIGRGDAPEVSIVVKPDDSKAIIDGNRRKLGKFSPQQKKDVLFKVNNLGSLATLKIQLFDSVMGDYWISDMVIKPDQVGISQILFTPPKINFVVAGKSPIVVGGDSFHAKISVQSDKPLLDTYLVVNDQQIYYKSYEDSPTNQVTLNRKISLRPGVNLITMVARQSQEFGHRQSITVFSEKGDPLLVNAELRQPLSLNDHP